MKILLIEDNELNRDMLTRRLEKKQMTVLCAENGELGYNLALSEENINIIIMDLSLPIINGWELASKLKNNDQTKNIPILALTAHAMKGDKETALEAGCDDYDTKPVDFSRLCQKIIKLTQ